jgi:general secretion pathway protein H
MRQREAGFTIIEMVVVLVILAMTALLVLPRLPDTSGTRLKTSARTLATTMRYLRDQAAVTRMPHRFRFFPGERKITLTILPPGVAEKSPDDPFLKREILAEGITVVDIQLPSLGKISSGEVTVDLGPAGVAEVTTIHLRESGGKQMTVTAFPFGGQIKVEEGYKEVLP